MKKFLLFLLGLFLLFNIALGALAGYGWHLFTRPGPLAEDKVLILEKGQGLRSIATKLHSEGIIENELSFIFGVRLKEQQKRLKAGEFLFPAGLSPEEAMQVIVSGKSISYSITIPEGLQSREIVALLNKEDKLVGDISGVLPQAVILPETYNFTRGDSRDQVISRMKAGMDQALEEVLKDFKPNDLIRNKNELLTLASIVEKETGKAEERPHVAGVFLNRLKKKMRLQSDPTVIYGITKGEEDLGRPIRKSDLKNENPYNTYVISGLPPGPICNPGLASIKAVLNPKETDDLYFVADGTGGHVFAKTLAEHNRNVRAWRKIERARKSN
ncbi:endolytic transglycosylase MltG [Sneathiella sp. P13V-1]|uniref:endolytic transglycosylase MltG n=1 Tax=Sneathiella sp. P13V-1 TaxID=2697366 RepID=UPI00187BA829|nr:endolytic transglycosylase MltG [Sneathiella sp. P13V-1]MBE7637006.1 endolytic transglycosylase MltG [Sneathiella sp. P13V-1]